MKKLLVLSGALAWLTGTISVVATVFNHGTLLQFLIFWGASTVVIGSLAFALFVLFSALDYALD